MRFRPAAFLASLLLATAAAPTIAQTSVPSGLSATSAPLDPAARTAIVAQLSTELRSRYIYPEVGERGAAAITAAAASGAYDWVTDLSAFIARLTDDLRGMLNDKHLSVFVADTPNRPAPTIASLPAGEAGSSAWTGLRARSATSKSSVSLIPGRSNPRSTALWRD